MKKLALILLLLLCLVATVGCAKTEQAWLADINALESSDMPKALTEAKALVEKFPDSAEAWAAYGRIALASKDNAGALTAGNAWMKLEPDNIAAARFTAEVAYAQKDADMIFSLLTPYQEKGLLTLADEILLMKGHFIKRDFDDVHAQVEALLSKDLDDTQRTTCYETNFNAYLLDSDFESALTTASDAVSKLPLDYSSILYRMQLHLAIDPANADTFHIYTEVMNKLSAEDKAKFVKLSLSDLNILERLSFNTEQLPRVKELLNESYAYIGGEPDPAFQSIGNPFHSQHIGQMGEQTFLMDPSTSEIVLHYPGNKSLIHLSNEFRGLTLANFLINGWQFVTMNDESINLTGFTSGGNIITTPVAPMKVYANYLDGGQLIVIDDMRQLNSVDIATKEVRNLKVDMSNTEVIGIKNHQLLAFSYTDNSLVKIDLSTGVSAPLTEDQALGHSDIVDYDGSSIYCINAWPSEAAAAADGKTLLRSVLYRIDPENGMAVKIADLLTADPNLTGKPSTADLEKADRFESVMTGGDYLYMGTTGGQLYRVKKDGSQLEKIGAGYSLYGVSDYSAYFKSSADDTLSALEHSAPVATMEQLSMD